MGWKILLWLAVATAAGLAIRKAADYCVDKFGVEVTLRLVVGIVMCLMAVVCITLVMVSCAS